MDNPSSPPPAAMASFTTAGSSGSGELLRLAMLRRDRHGLAKTGWRGSANRLSGGLFRAGPGAAELQAAAGRQSLRRSFTGPRTVLVANPKGGAGKTPTTLMLAATLGGVRGGRVVAWDNNETRGTLGMRAQHPAGAAADATVWDLLSLLDHFERGYAGAGELAGFLRAQEAYFDVLASDDDAARMAQIGAREFARIHEVLARHYHLLLIDTGNNLRAQNWQAAVEVTDALVVVSTHEWDAGYSASWMLAHLCALGRADLVAGAVTVLTAAEPRVDRETREELIRHFSETTAAVIEVPYDPALRGGGEIDLPALRDGTRRAWADVALAVCDQLSRADVPSEGAALGARVPVGAPTAGYGR